MPLRFYANTRIGELLSRLGNDVSAIQNAVTDTLLSLLSNTIMLIGGIVIIFVMAWRLTFIILAVVPLAVLGMIFLGRIVRKLSRQVQDALADSSAMAEEALGGVRIVKSFAREPYEVGKYGSAVEKLFQIALDPRAPQFDPGSHHRLHRVHLNRPRALVWQPRSDRRQPDPGRADRLPPLHDHDRVTHGQFHRALQPVPARAGRERAGLRAVGHAARDAR